MNPELVDRAADMFVSIYQGSPPVVGLPDAVRPTSIPDAQQIVDALTEKLALPIKGWKTYFPFKASQPALLTPIFTLLDSPAHITPDTAKLRLLEPEVVFLAERDLPPRDEPYSFDEVADAMVAVPAFEVLDVRFTDVAKLQTGAPEALLEVYADNNMNACFVLGQPHHDWRAIDFPRQRVVTTVGGEVVSDVRGGHPVFDPSLLLATGVDLLHDRGGIHAGQIIGNHTVAGIFPGARGARIISDFEGLGSVEATYVD